MNLNDFDILLILLHANSARYCKLWAFLSRRFPTRMRSGCRGPGTWMFWRYLARPSWCLTVFDKRLLLDLCGKWAFLRCEPHMMWNDLNESLIKWVCYCLTWHVDRSRSQIVRLSAGCRHWFEHGSHEKRQGGSFPDPGQSWKKSHIQLIPSKVKNVTSAWEHIETESEGNRRFL